MFGLVEFSVVPIGTGDASVSEYVKTAYDILKSSGLNFELNSMGTIVEGDIKKILDIIIKINQKLEDKKLKRIITSIKIDYRIDKKSTLKGKINSVIGDKNEQKNT